MTIGNEKIVDIKFERLADAIEDAKKRVHKGSKVVYLDSNTGSDSYSGTRLISPFATLSAAHASLTASQGDTIIVLPNHAETISAAAGVDLSKANIRLIGLNVAGQKPTFTFGTVTGASIDVTGNGIEVSGIIGLAGLDALTKPFNITGNNCNIDIEWRDASSTVEAETAVRLDTADNCKLNLLYRGFTAGNAAVRVVAVDDCDNVEINIDAYGVVSTAWVNLVDAASTNVKVRGRMYTQGVTNFTRDVVDTIGGSTWDAIIFDSSAGAQVSGGSGAALAIDDITALSTKLDTIDDFLDTEIETLITSTGTTIPALHAVPTADASTDTNMRDVVGRKTDAAVTTVGTTKSLMAYLKGLTNTVYSLPQCVEKSDGSVSTPDDLFTITGGPIKILEITGIVTTQIGAGTTNVKLQIATTDPSATIDMNAAAVDIDGDAVGTSYQTINTTGIFTPVTAGYVKEANSFATLPTTFLAPIGTIKFTSDAARTGNIKWYLRYVPLSPNSRVVAAA